MDDTYAIFESINVNENDTFSIIFRRQSHTMVPNNAGFPTPVLLQSKCRLVKIMSDERFIAEMYNDGSNDTLLLVLNLYDVIICKQSESCIHKPQILKS